MSEKRYTNLASKPISQTKRTKIRLQCSAEAAIPREYRGNFSNVAAETP